MNRGWRNESVRHSLAAKGVKTNYMARKSWTKSAFKLSDQQLANRARRSKRDLAKGAKLTAEASKAEPVDQAKVDELKLQSFQSPVGQKRVLEAKQDASLNESLGLPQQTFEKVGKGGAAARGSSARALAKIDFEKADKLKAKEVIRARLNREIALGDSGSEEKKKFLRLADRSLDLKTPAGKKVFKEIAEEKGEKKTTPKKAAKKPRAEPISIEDIGGKPKAARKSNAKVSPAPKTGRKKIPRTASGRPATNIKRSELEDFLARHRGKV